MIYAGYEKPIFLEEGEATMLNRVKKIGREYIVGAVIGPIIAVVLSNHLNPLYAIGVGSLAAAIINIALGELMK